MSIEHNSVNNVHTDTKTVYTRLIVRAMLAMIMMVYTGSKSCINITTNPHTLSMD